METSGNLTTVYRSADATGKQDASAVRNLLVQHGLDAQLLGDDDAVGVVEGSWEVRVQPQQAAEAEALIANVDGDSLASADPSSELDMVTIAELQGVSGEMEAIGMRTILDANGVNTVVVGASSIPSLAFMVQVSREDVERAQTILAEAQAAGPQAALEAERETEERV
jgi:hypothetical protein